MKNLRRKASLLISLILLITQALGTAGQTCLASGTIVGSTPPPGQCNTENHSDCCVQGQQYAAYTCSPPVSSNTLAILTLNSFQKGGDGGAPSECDNQYHSDEALVVALSTGWFNGGSRCNKFVQITANGLSVRAMVVDECDSTMGCDAEHDYQPPCLSNAIDASIAVWKALGISEDNVDLGVFWTDA